MDTDRSNEEALNKLMKPETVQSKGQQLPVDEYKQAIDCGLVIVRNYSNILCIKKFNGKKKMKKQESSLSQNHLFTHKEKIIQQKRIPGRKQRFSSVHFSFFLFLVVIQLQVPNWTVSHIFPHEMGGEEPFQTASWIGGS